MTDARAVITAALELHQPVEDGEGNFCSCSSIDVLLEQGIATDYRPEHLADVLSSLDGIAIVTLPEPHNGRWEVDPADYDFHVAIMDLVRIQDGSEVAGVRVAWGEVDLGLVPAHARALAAALLAAASAAEKADSNG